MTSHREQLAQIPLTCRAHAGLNPRAVYRTPLTMADYLSARMISWPLCLYDCDVPVDASTAFVVSAAETAPDLRSRPVYVDAVGTAMHTRYSWDQQERLDRMTATTVAEHLWGRSSLRPADVDVAELYDGFSILTLAWIEALGFCQVGEGGAFIEGGKRIALDGELPLNTSGGQLSAGRLHGFGHVHEAVMQLRGHCGGKAGPGCPGRRRCQRRRADRRRHAAG
jgi:acetyl-CoA acetyltransferase